MTRRHLLSWVAGVGWSLGSSVYLAVGLLVFGWSPLMVILALWFETLLGLGVCVLRMRISQRQEPERPPTALEKEYASWSPERAVGMGAVFLLVHGLFLGGIVLYLKDEVMLALLLSPFIHQMPAELVGPVGQLQHEFAFEVLLLVAEAIAGLVYFDVVRKEYQHRTPGQAAMAYFTGGVALNHLIIFFGVVGLVVYRVPHALAVAIVAWKLLFDARAYAQWRAEKAANREAPPKPAQEGEG